MRQPDFAGAARALHAYQNYRSRLSRMSIEVREADVQPVLSDDETAGQDRRTASPSVPVESREQPSGLAEAAGRLHRDGIGLLDALAERDATIIELRAEAAREFESGNEWCQRALASEAALETTRAERDRARDLAAHLEEHLARLRAGIQGDIDSQRAWGFHFVPSPALTAHLEAEQAE